MGWQLSSVCAHIVVISNTHPIQTLLLLIQITLQTWGSLITESVIVHEYSPAELLCAVVLKPSWPVPRLSVVFDAMGAEVLAEHGAYLFACQSPQPGTLKVLLYCCTVACTACTDVVLPAVLT